MRGMSTRKSGTRKMVRMEEKSMEPFDRRREERMGEKGKVKEKEETGVREPDRSDHAMAAGKWGTSGGTARFPSPSRSHGPTTPREVERAREAKEEAKREEARMDLLAL